MDFAFVSFTILDRILLLAGALGAAAGCSGTVYLTIPAGGTGRVNVRIGQRLREMDAVHATGGELPTGTPIRVLRVDRSLAIVQSLSSKEL